MTEKDVRTFFSPIKVKIELEENMTQEIESRIQQLETDVSSLKTQVQALTKKTDIDYISKEVSKRIGRGGC